jgi:hypothetical protein
MHKAFLIYADNITTITTIIYPTSELIINDTINCKLPNANEVIYDINNSFKNTTDVLQLFANSTPVILYASSVLIAQPILPCKFIMQTNSSG